MRIVYLCHPLNAPTREGIDANRLNASRWMAWLAREFPIAPVASWITLSAEWPETPENRARGLEIDKALVARCDETWMVGGRISEGMKVEAEAARVVRDLTALGYPAPEAHSPLTRAFIAEAVELR